SFENLADTGASVGSILFQFAYLSLPGLRTISTQLKEAARSVPVMDRLIADLEKDLYSTVGKKPGNRLPLPDQPGCNPIPSWLTRRHSAGWYSTRVGLRERGAAWSSTGFVPQDALRNGNSTTCST